MSIIPPAPAMPLCLYAFMLPPSADTLDGMLQRTGDRSPPPPPPHHCHLHSPSRRMLIPTTCLFTICPHFVFTSSSLRFPHHLGPIPPNIPEYSLRNTTSNAPATPFSPPRPPSLPPSHSSSSPCLSLASFSPQPPFETCPGYLCLAR